MTHGDITRPLAPSGIPLRRLALIGLSAVGLAGTISIFAAAGGSPGFDTYAYWLTGHGPLYAVRDGFGAFQYTPAALFFLWPVSLLPWPLAFPVWLVISAAALVALGRRWALALLVFLPVPMELFEGNIDLLLALAILVGFRYPAAWAFVLVTKMTPGIGLLWFAFRREWRPLAIAIAATALLLAASLLIPGAWTAWWTHMTDRPVGPTPNQVNMPVWFRLPLAAALVAWGARTDRRWTVIVAATLALPALWLYSLSMLVGLVPLRRSEVRGRRACR
jgi:Glycosyltransferase family 87